MLDHYNDPIMRAMASQITNITIVYSIVYSGADQRKHQSSASLAFVRGIHRWPVNSPHKGPVTRKMFPFDGVIRKYLPGLLAWASLSFMIGSWLHVYIMMTPSNGNIFRITGPLCGETTGQRRIPLTKASDAKLWCFLWSAPEETVQPTIEMPVIWDAIASIMAPL